MINIFCILLTTTVYSASVWCLQNRYETNKTLVHEKGKMYSEDLQKLFGSFFNWLEKFIEGSDPLSIEYQSLDAENILLMSKGYLKDLLISDLSRLKIKPQINYDGYLLDTLYFGILVNSESLQVIGYYDLDFNFIDEFLVNGAGDFGIATYGMNVSFEIYLWTFHDDSLFVPWVCINYNVTKIQVQFEGLYGEAPVSKLVNSILNDVLVRIMNQYKTLISGTLSILTNFLINRNLNGLKLSNITNIIHHIIGN